MTKQYDETNRWKLFHNGEKKNPKGPDYSGTVNINGVEYKLAGWKTKTSNGGVMLSGPVTPAEEQQQTRQTQTDDDTPF